MAHWKGLSNDTADGGTTPDHWARTSLVAPSAVVLIWGLIAKWVVMAPIPLLTGVTLLSGGILGVFAQLSTLRLKLTDRMEDATLDVERDGIDEAVAHLLTALLICVFCAVAIVVGLNTTTPENNVSGQTILGPPWSAFVLAGSTYLSVLFLIIIPKLYSAYVEMNNVRSRLSGFQRSPSRFRSRIRR